MRQRALRRQPLSSQPPSAGLEDAGSLPPFRAPFVLPSPVLTSEVRRPGSTAPRTRSSRHSPAVGPSRPSACCHRLRSLRLTARRLFLLAGTKEDSLGASCASSGESAQMFRMESRLPSARSRASSNGAEELRNGAEEIRKDRALARCLFAGSRLLSAVLSADSQRLSKISRASSTVSKLLGQISRRSGT